MRNMVTKEDGNVESKSSCEDSPSSNSKVEPSTDSSHDEGDLFKVRRMMNAQGKLCSIIIGGSSSINVASLRLVKKLNLPTLVHSTPYKL
ncbi:hypothetical protein CR513_37361, partial [Mucuna pruriens]